MKQLLNKAITVLIVVLLCCGVFFGTKFYYSRQIKTVEVVKEVPIETIIEKEIQISGETI